MNIMNILLIVLMMAFAASDILAIAATVRMFIDCGVIYGLFFVCIDIILFAVQLLMIFSGGGV